MICVRDRLHQLRHNCRRNILVFVVFCSSICYFLMYSISGSRFNSKLLNYGGCHSDLHLDSLENVLISLVIKI